MAEQINFNKGKAERFIDCLATGKSIHGPFNHDDMMALAGACLFVARSHGSLPHRLQKHGAGAMALDNLPPEFLISTDAQFLEESNAAVEFYAHLSELVKDGFYDDGFEPHFLGFVSVDGGEKKIHPVLGHKGNGEQAANTAE